MARVKTYTRRQNGRTQTVRQHDRSTPASRPSMFTLSPGRGVRNLGRSFMAWKHRRKAVALGLAGLAVGELVGFTVFKVSGGILVGVGMALSLLGAGLLVRT